MRLTIGQGLLFVGLGVVITMSALGVVFTTHKARVATHELETLRHQTADLHVESGQLLLEKSSLSAYARVEKNALENLDMMVPSTEDMVIVEP
jgi:cell division protein FtsL